MTTHSAEYPDHEASSGRPFADAIQPLRIEVHREHDRARVTPIGELDIATVGQLDDQLSRLHGAGLRHLVLDLRELTFIDSTALRLILRWDSHANQNGTSFALIKGTSSIQRIFEITRLGDRLRFAPTPEPSVEPS